jgi:hypothetical protein
VIVPEPPQISKQATKIDKQATEKKPVAQEKRASWNQAKTYSEEIDDV